MSLDGVHIVMLYGRPRNINLKRSIKFSITFSKHGCSMPPGSKKPPALMNFGGTFQGRPIWVLKRRVHNEVLETPA